MGLRHFIRLGAVELPFAGLGAMLWCVLLSGGFSPAAHAGSVEYVVREQLDRKEYDSSVRRQLLSYGFSAPQDACHPDSLRLNGPDGEVPVQFSDLETWEGTPFVKSATVNFIVDNPQPLSATTFTLTYADKPLPRTAEPVEPDPALRVVEAQDTVLVTSSRYQFRVRLLSGEQTYAQPAPAADVPGPLQGISFGEDPWSEPSRMFGAIPVKSWTAKLVDNGPVFARVAFRYTFADDNVLTLTARVASADSAVRWEMAVREDRPEQGLEMPMLRMPGAKEAMLPKGYGQWARDRTLPLKAEPFVYLSPNSSLPNVFPDSPAHIRIQREDQADINFYSHDPGAWTEPAATLTFAGFKTLDNENIPRVWDRWQRKRIAVSYIDETPVLRMSLAKGQRKWTISLGAAQVGDQLQRTNAMVLDWPAANAPRPWLFVDRQRIEDLWKEIGDDPGTLRERGLLTDDAVSMTTMLNRRARMASAAWNVRMMMSDHLPTSFAARRGLANKKTQEKMEDWSQYMFDGSPPQSPREAFMQRMYFEHARTAPVQHLQNYLRLLGNFDVMRHAITVAALYDALIDSDLITAEQRPAFRAQTAYLAYLMADPTCWDMERGYVSGNTNMSVSYTLSLGILACALRNHPMAKTWTDHATRWMDKWLADEVGPNGEWIPEGTHYGIVSLEPMLAYAAAAKRAGFHDFTNDPRLKRLTLFWAHQHTPPDPGRGDLRVSGSYGRGSASERFNVFGVAARLFAASDPDFSRQMQWMWAQTGYPVDGADFRMGGYDAYYMDRNLPMRAPRWESENFPNIGAVLRHAFDTADESHLNVLSNVQSRENLDVWPPGVGGIAQWFACGKPLSTCFTFKYGMQERHDLVRDGVRLTHPWAATGTEKNPFGYYTTTNAEAFASLASADYVRSTFSITHADPRDWFPDELPAYPSEPRGREGKLDWTRQMLFLKDADPVGPAYLVLHDSTRGGQPTVWQFWTLSEKLGAASEAADVEAFLADKPGPTILPARELPRSDRFTAIGQFGVDMEFFIAGPTNTPRHTLRYGGVLQRRPEYQDLLHLQLPGDGSYYVALFPRAREAQAPAFTALAEGKIIKIAGGFGTDYALLAPVVTTAAAEGVMVSGTAAAVQTRPDGSGVLTVAAAGDVRWKDFGIRSDTAASLHATADGQLTLTIPPGSEGGDVTIRAPAGYRLEGRPKDVQVSEDGGVYAIAVPAGAQPIVLKK